MKNKKQNLKELPKGTKFATHKFGNENDILLEFLIATLILNGSSLSELLEPINSFNDKKDEKEMKIKVTNTVLNFINLNPEFAVVLEINNKAHEFLNSLRTDFQDKA